MPTMPGGLFMPGRQMVYNRLVDDDEVNDEYQL